MPAATKIRWFFGGWATLAVILGSVLMSYHQPFVAPASGVLSLAGPGDGKHWRAVHFLSASCGCSQLVMKHLLARGTLADVAEQVVVIDSGEPSLRGSDALLQSLGGAGFRVSHVRVCDIPADAGLKGVPLLLYAQPDNRTVYAGGYGRTQDGDVSVYRELRSGIKSKPLQVLGCAVGTRLRHAVDPFGLKY